MKQHHRIKIYQRLTVSDLATVQGPGTVVVLRGRVWLTLDKQPGDYFLTAGQRWELQPADYAAISGEPLASIRVDPVGAPGLIKTAPGDPNVEFIRTPQITIVGAGRLPDVGAIHRMVAAGLERLSQQTRAFGRYLSYGWRT
jgi:Protein of unknown function (DUF2917)